VPRRAYRHLRTRRRVLPLLVGLTLMTGLLTSGVAYLGARLASVNTAQDTLTANAHTAKRVLAEQGTNVALRAGSLIVSSSTGANLLVLDGDTRVVSAVGDLTGADATIYQLRGGQYVAVSASDQGVLGSILPITATTALDGDSDYSGVITQADADYVTGITPLVDATGTPVGAIGVGRSMGDVLAPANTLGLALLAASALLALLALLVGLRFAGTLSNAALAKLDDRLNDVATHAADLEQMVRTQVSRAQRQERLARQITDCSRDLNTLMDAVEQGQAALRESASEIWAGMSLPGQLLDPATATRLARQSAIVAGRIGSATEDARERYRILSCMMNQVIAEGRVLGDEGRVVEDRANRLRQAIERVEMALGAKVVGRQYDLPGHPFARRLRRPSRRLSGPYQGTPSHPQGRRRSPASPYPPTVASGPAMPYPRPSTNTAADIYKQNAASAIKLDPATPTIPSAWTGASSTNPANPGPRGAQWPTSGTPGDPSHPRPPLRQMDSSRPFGPPPLTPHTPQGPLHQPGASDGSRPGSGPLWSQSGLRPASYSGGALPGLSLPGISLPADPIDLSALRPGPPGPQIPGQPPRQATSPSNQIPPHPGTTPNGAPPPNGVGRGPAPKTDWINGNRSTPANPSAGNRSRPPWPQPGQQPGQPGQSAPHTEWLND
jgi:hypothetical protein